MKKLLVYLAGLLSVGGAAEEREPTDPNELHDFLYKHATDLAEPYLVLQDVPGRNAKSAKGRSDLERAINLFERVLGLNPRNWAAAWFAGKAAQSLGDQERAYAFFKRSFEVQKANPDVARELMLTCLDTLRAKEGVAVAEHAVSLNDSDAGLKANLALARVCAGDIPGARKAIDAAMRQDPADQISLTLKKLIAEIERGERKTPKRPADLEK